MKSKERIPPTSILSQEASFLKIYHKDTNNSILLAQQFVKVLVLQCLSRLAMRVDLTSLLKQSVNWPTISATATTIGQDQWEYPLVYSQPTSCRNCTVKLEKSSRQNPKIPTWSWNHSTYDHHSYHSSSNLSIQSLAAIGPLLTSWTNMTNYSYFLIA